MSLKRTNQFCKKCNTELIYYEPSITYNHCGTDYWTRFGERRFKPKICMACRSKLGQKAQKAQAKSIALHRNSI